MVITTTSRSRVRARLLSSASVIAAAAAITLPIIAYGQGATGTAAPAQAPGNSTENVNPVPEQLVVTAERRTVNLQQTSIAASALSGADLDKKAVEDIADLQRATPALSVIDQGFTQSINIRGIGLSVVSPAVDPGVATYRDGVFLPTQTTLSEPFFDIQNVEVLRGPQGTFVGQNATGGAVFINSNSPSLTDGISGDVSAGLGNYGDLALRGAINLPISDTLAARVAFSTEDRDSFFKDIGSSTIHPGNLDNDNFRFSLLWKPTDALSVLFKTQYDRSLTDGYAYKPIPGTAFAPFAPSEAWVIDSDRQDLKDNELYVRSSLQIDYTFPDGIKLRSNTGYQYNNEQYVSDLDATALPIEYQTNDYTERTTTQDVSLISPDDTRLRWVLGSTFFNYTDRIDSTEGVPGENVHIVINLPKSSYGFFGSTTYSITPELELEVGARYSGDNESFKGFTQLTPGPFLPADATGSGSQWTGKIDLNWKPDSDNLVYAFWSKGYKAGGVNTDASIFAPETVYDYELGWKTTELDGHLRTQLGAYYMTYDNFQAVTFDPANTQTSVTNAGASTIKGFEGQAQFRQGGWGADGSFAYVNSSMGAVGLVNTERLPGGSATGLGVQCPPGVASNPPLCFNYQPFFQTVSGAANPYSPQWTGNVGLEYEFEVGGGSLTPRVDVSYIAPQWVTFFEEPRDYIASRTLVNLRATYEFEDWTVEAYATNLFDRLYVVGQSSFGNNEFFGAPQQYGIRVSRSF